jgi:hypothetical protein
VVLIGGHLKFTDEKGKTQEVYFKQGECRWFPAFKPRVENLGDTDYNARYMGNKSKACDTRNSPNTAQPTMDAENEKLMRRGNDGNLTGEDFSPPLMSVPRE